MSLATFFKKHKRLTIFSILLCSVIALQFLGMGKYFGVAALKARAYQLQAFVTEHYVSAVMYYITLYITLVAACLPAAMFMTVTGGFLFGTVPGAVYANIGATLGSTIAFLAVRRWFGAAIQERYKTHLVAFNKAMEKDGATYLIVGHFVAVIPFFLVNLLAGLTKVSTWTFVWTTSLGILPASLIYTYSGSQLSTITSVKDIFSTRMLIALLLLAFLAMVPTIIQKVRERRGA